MSHLRSILITGITGLIGGEAAFALADAGHQVHGLVRASSHQEARARLAQRAARSGRQHTHGITPIPGDITQPLLGLATQDWQCLRGECQIVIHAAAETRFTAHRSLAPTNASGTGHLLSAAVELPQLQRFVHVSSAAVTTAPMHGVIPDDAPHAGFENEYVRTKRQAESLVLASGLPVCIARPSIVVSAGLNDPEFARAILWVIPLAVQQGWLPLHGVERLDFIPVALAAAGIQALALTKNAPLYCNISAGPASSVSCREIAEALHHRRHAASPLAFDPLPENQATKKPHKALNLYLPFISADVVYENTRMSTLTGIPPARVPRFVDYMDSLLSQISAEDALLGSLTA